MEFIYIFSTLISYGVFLQYLRDEAPHRYQQFGGDQLLIWPPSQFRLFLYMLRLGFLKDLKSPIGKIFGTIDLAIVLYIFSIFSFGGLFRTFEGG